ncbi:hypothetical protein BJX76DRAFT_330042 [Aspergillus varians]
MSTAAALPILAKTSSWVESHPSPAISNRQFGTVKSYNGEQGFGLIVSDFGGELILRQQSLANGDISLKEGMKVSYEPVHGPILLMADKVQAEE